ncbi:putative protein involved in vacuole import and degradation [Monocercomonoides exilis]|uniref:putative protein involved in vacuole import and degradation n=1 Tax=Monocercomonoides exilis TaxID=2049356 RepID=UPI003559E18D|nr:putative protein involved in vacuole import and degradation [Monocercomonoides exilis]|eukprot:MONOS_1249.1-p1 / transcript=MONOS_1249.1 / gene=MONOS_1249 / organism=Monocercomonoides_exilis_PA203 / gene_product=protein involved in vacuole import and degradation, putative / transcript_product=protein involved in vacuole import and degradation, putative / location=Mono_scaffold00021:110911-113259(-) / protein_length=782 / sequence_SO=supercontig / SO=protein_coding / is_pseudo=false
MFGWVKSAVGHLNPLSWKKDNNVDEEKVIEQRMSRSNPRKDNEQLIKTLTAPSSSVPHAQDSLLKDLPDYPELPPKHSDDDLPELGLPAPLIQVHGVLFIFNGRAQQFELAEPSCTVSIYPTTNDTSTAKPQKGKKTKPFFDFNLYISKEDGTPLILHRLTPDLNLTFLDAHQSFVFVTHLERTVLTLTVRIVSSDEFEQFRTECIKKLFEVNNQIPWEKCEDQELLLNGSRKTITEDDKDEDESELDFEEYDDELEKKEMQQRELELIEARKRELNLRARGDEMIESEEEEEKEEEEDDEEEEHDRKAEKSSSATASSKHEDNRLLLVGRSVPRSFVITSNGGIDIYGLPMHPEDEDEEEDEEEEEGKHSRGKKSRRGQNSGPMKKIHTFSTVKGLASSLGASSDGMIQLVAERSHPSQAMLYRSDNQMLVRHPLDMSRVMALDLERGQVVEEWGTNEVGTKIDGLIGATKESPHSDNPLFVAFNKQGHFLMDPRIASQASSSSTASSISTLRGESDGLHGRLCSDAGHSFFYSPSTRANLLCEASTMNGCIVSGSAKGDLRFFDESLKNRAKTMMSVGPEAIIGIDVSADGEWVVATTQTCLLVVPTLLSASTEASPISCFTKSMPREDKARLQVRRLELSYRDVMRLGGRVCFTPAKFDDEGWVTMMLTQKDREGSNSSKKEEGKEEKKRRSMEVGFDDEGGEGRAMPKERAIVTTSGPFIITWNMRRVKQGKVTDYQMKRMPQIVVDGDFSTSRTLSQKGIVVAMENDVTVEGIHLKK